jgi:hypothetical protein
MYDKNIYLKVFLFFFLVFQLTIKIIQWNFFFMFYVIKMIIIDFLINGLVKLDE